MARSLAKEKGWSERIGRLAAGSPPSSSRTSLPQKPSTSSRSSRRERTAARSWGRRRGRSSTARSPAMSLLPRVPRNSCMPQTSPSRVSCPSTLIGGGVGERQPEEGPQLVQVLAAQLEAGVEALKRARLAQLSVHPRPGRPETRRDAHRIGLVAVPQLDRAEHAARLERQLAVGAVGLDVVDRRLGALGDEAREVEVEDPRRRVVDVVQRARLDQDRARQVEVGARTVGGRHRPRAASQLPVADPLGALLQPQVGAGQPQLVEPHASDEKRQQPEAEAQAVGAEHARRGRPVGVGEGDALGDHLRAPAQVHVEVAGDLGLAAGGRRDAIGDRAAGPVPAEDLDREQEESDQDEGRAPAAGPPGRGASS